MLIIRKFFKWVFKDELQRLERQIQRGTDYADRLEYMEGKIKNVLENIDVSVDVHTNPHRYAPSWAVISLQGQKADYIKFIDLGDRDLREIASYLRQFDRINNIKIDARPDATRFLRIETHNL